MAKKVIVAVHGTGEPTEYATLKQTLAQICQYHNVPAAVPLGNFHAAGKALVLSPPRYPQEMGDLAFAEVYWAGVPRKLVKQMYSLEDIDPWVKTISERVRLRRPAGEEALTDADQRMIERVLGEMLTSIDVLERLCFIADKMGIFSFDLKKVLVDYIDDIQVVAEFKDQGLEIGKLFSQRLEAVHQEYPGAEIHLITHSEGTVVAMLGLLSALCSPPGQATWIDSVRGFMTFGSPIDKHLALWPELFDAYTTPCRTLARPIEWQNYYDYGDPVGFKLDDARKRFTTGAWAAIFNFPAENDHGFARYPLPGKAHTDYWQDSEVFGHFIRKVVYAEQVPPKPDAARYEKAPGSKSVARIVSWVVPYALMAALLFCAVFVLYKGLHGHLDPEQPDSIARVFCIVASLSGFLAGLTVMARIPRMTRKLFWHVTGIVFFLLCLAGSAAGIRACGMDVDFGNLLGLAALLGIVVFLTGKLSPEWGIRVLLAVGTAITGGCLFLLLQGPATRHHGDLWPVFLAAAVFLYLWWLVVLLFDLVFVWHRYIRYAARTY